MSHADTKEEPLRLRPKLVGAPFSEPVAEAPLDQPYGAYERAFSFSPASQAQEESPDDVISITLDEPEDVEEEALSNDSPDRAAGQAPTDEKTPYSVRGWASLDSVYVGTKETWVYCSVALRLLRRRGSRAWPVSLLRRSWAALREYLQLKTCKKRKQRPVSSVLPDPHRDLLLEDKKLS